MSDDPEEDDVELFPDITSQQSDEPAARSDEVADGEQPQEVEKASKAARKLEPVILAHVLGPNYQPVKPRVIARQLKLPSEQHKALKLAIRRLAKAGKISYGAGHLVRPPGKGKVESRKSKVEGPGSRFGGDAALTPALSQRERVKRADGAAASREARN